MNRKPIQYGFRVGKGSSGGGGEVLPYMGYIGMCRCEGYGFQAVYSRIGYISSRGGGGTAIYGLYRYVPL